MDPLSDSLVKIDTIHPFYPYIHWSRAPGAPAVGGALKISIHPMHVVLQANEGTQKTMN